MSGVWAGSAAGRRRAIAAVVCVLLPACASDDRTVGAGLAGSDLALIAQATQQALEESPVGLGSNWTNQETGHRGTVMPTRTFTSGRGATCRDYQQTATVEGRTVFAFDRACRSADGQWRSSNYDSLAGAIRRGESQYAYARRPYPYYYDDPFCRWPYRDPLCQPYYYGYPSSSVGFGFGFGL